MKVYIGTRAKTSQTFTIPLLKPDLAILKKYNNHLPIISNVKYNEYLKEVAQNAGIDKPVSSHWARYPNLPNIQTFLVLSCKPMT